MKATETSTKSSARIFRRGNLLWLAAYALVMAAVVAAMLELRRVALATLDMPKARAQWQAWREAPPNRRTDLPVKRHPPSSDEPPALVLMRDYFGVMMSAALVFGSLLFAMIMFSVRGVLWRDREHAPSPGKAGG